MTNKPTLFLDRDGVINVQEPGKYVNSVEDFVFADGALDALRILSGVFGKIIVVSNQQGVARGFLTMDGLNEIYGHMLEQIDKAGGRIDHIYTCTEMEPSNCRKPNTGMALRARWDYPEIDFFHSVMVGDFISDMQFGAHLGMVNVFIAQEFTLDQVIVVDFCYDSLYAFAVGVNTVLKVLENRS